MNKLFYAVIIAALFCACTSPLRERCNRMTIDNPTEEDYFLVVDIDTLGLPAYTYLEYQAACSDAEGNPLNNTHHYVVLDKDKKPLFDTSITSSDDYLFINPTRSTYIEWKVYYGDDAHFDEYSTLMYDSIEFEGVFTEYTSFAFVTEAGGVIGCDRSVDQTIEVFNENNNYKHFFFRQPDFVVAYFGFMQTDPKESARVDLYNMLTDLYNSAVESKGNGLISDMTLNSWYDDISYEHFSEAVSTANSYSFLFKDEAIEKLNRYYDTYNSATALEPMQLPFTRLHTVDFGYRDDGTLYEQYTSDYDPETGDCESDYNDGTE